MTKALAVHTYLGGMALGAERVFDVMASVESWKPGIEARGQAGVSCKTCSFDDYPRGAGIVLANPPCSRFSNSAVKHFSDEDRSRIDNFPDLQQILSVADDADAVWWETGPLYWSMGRGMARNIHEWAKATWGEATTLVVKIDPRWHSQPQRRPRCHHVTFRGRRNPSPVVPECTWDAHVAEKITLGDWLATQHDRWKFDGDHVPLPPKTTGWSRSSPTTKGMKWLRLGSMFVQTMPVDMAATDWYSLTVLSGRFGAWVDEERWVSAEDWAMIQTCPPTWAREIARANPGQPGHALTMLSKGVSPDVAEFVAEWMVRPVIEGGGSEPPDAKYVQYGEDKWEIDLSMPDAPKRRNGRARP